MSSRRFVFLWLVFVCGVGTLSAYPPPYVTDRRDARKELLEFARASCPAVPDARSHIPARRTFERAIDGDFDALTVVFKACDYYGLESHDEYDGLSEKPWKLLHTVGDQRFADYLLGLDAPARKAVLYWILVVRDWYSGHPLADYDGYLKKNFPRVAAIALAWEPSSPPPKDFLSSITYPYRAPEERRLRIERAARELKVGATEKQVLALLGPPDYKASVNHRDKRTGQWSVAGESWHYVHSLDHPIEPGDRGRMLIITLSNKTTPRTVAEVSPSGL